MPWRRWRGDFVMPKDASKKRSSFPQLRWASGAADVSRSFRVAHSVAVAANWRMQARI